MKKEPPEVLNRLVDKVLAYKPKEKAKKPRKRKPKARKVKDEQRESSI